MISECEGTAQIPGSQPGIALGKWLLLGLLLLPIVLFAETPRQDSLRAAIAAPRADTLELDALVQLARSYFATNLDSAFCIGQRARVAAARQENPEYFAEGENAMGIARLFQGRNREALGHFEKVLQIREGLREKKMIAAAANNIALAHQELGNSSEAIDYHLRSLRIKEELGDTARIRISYNNIGLIYEQLKDYATARFYYGSALKMIPRESDTIGYLTCIYNLGVTHLEEGNNDSALFFLRQSLPLAEKVGDKRMLGLHYMLYGVVDQRNGQYRSAGKRIQRGLDLFREIGKEDQMAAALAHLGDNCLALQRPGRARELCQEGLVYARRSESLEKEANCLECLHRSYAGLGQSGKAYAAAREFMQLRDSIGSENTLKQIMRKDLEYSFQKQALADSMQSARSSTLLRMKYENELQRQEAVTLYLIVIGALLLGLAILFYVNNRNRQRLNLILEERVRTRTQELEKQNERLAEYAYMNAHLLRQPLTQILGLISLIYLAKSPQEREEYLKLLRHSAERLDQVVHEIRDVVEEESVGTI
ncbi:MAG: tetratricopeptide repeat protein [Bacteroidota bacterium]